MNPVAMTITIIFREKLAQLRIEQATPCPQVLYTNDRACTPPSLTTKGYSTYIDKNNDKKRHDLLTFFSNDKSLALSKLKPLLCKRQKSAEIPQINSIFFFSNNIFYRSEYEFHNLFHFLSSANALNIWYILNTVGLFDV